MIISLHLTPTHKWKIEIEGDSNLAVKCKISEGDGRGASSNDEYQLKFNFDVGEEEQKGLLKDGESDVTFDVEFKALGDWQKLQPFTKDEEDITMVVFMTEGAKAFDVTLYKNERGEGQLDFKCTDENLVVSESIDESEQMFSGEMTKSDNKTLVSSDSEEELEEGKVWIEDCKRDNEKTVTCDLKVVTEIKSFKSQKNYCDLT